MRGISRDGHVDTVEVVTKAGVCMLEAPVFIDASGDADLAASVGVPCERGGGKRQQAVTCMFQVGNVDLLEVELYMEERVNTEKKTPWTFDNAPLRASHKYWTPWKMFPEYERAFPKQFGVYYHGTPGDVFINCTHTSIDSLDPEDITEGTMLLRRQVMDHMDFLKSYVWGFERAYLTHIYDLGVRESRRIQGEYQLTVEDMKSEREFEDTVAMGAYPPDLHDARGGDILISGKGWSNEEESSSAMSNLPYNPGYQIPYRCMLAKTHDNLLVAGRSLSATFEAQAAARGMGPCAAMGQAAGTAAALAAGAGCTPKALPFSTVRAALLRDGACLQRQAEVNARQELQLSSIPFI